MPLTPQMLAEVLPRIRPSADQFMETAIRLGNMAEAIIEGNVAAETVEAFKVHGEQLMKELLNLQWSCFNLNVEIGRLTGAIWACGERGRQ